MKKDRINVSEEQSNESVVTVRGEGNNKATAKRVALRRAGEAAAGKPYTILEERYSPQGSGYWCFLTISF